MTTTRPLRWAALMIGALVAIMVAAIGATLTDLGPWYHSLREPSWKPPDVLFGPMWTIILALAVLSGVRAFVGETDPVRRQTIMGLFALNGLLNILWSLLFFAMRRPDFAAIEVVPYWLSILALVRYLYPRARVSALLLLPHLCWVGIAGVLNYQVVALNRPFG
jgi:tryptophan-rich sensory protein